MEVLVVVSVIAVVKLIGFLKRQFLARRHAATPQCGLDSRWPSAYTEVRDGTQ